MLIHRYSILVPVLGLTVVAWIVAVQTMRGMDGGPGTGLGSFAWFLGVWVTMTTAMMLPSSTPTALLFARLRGRADTAALLSGHLLAWVAYGVVAYALYRVAAASTPASFAWSDRGPWVAGGTLAASGLYQLTPLKSACLRLCRSPLHFLLRARPGGLGALRAGVSLGAYCIGCCAGLMLALFAVGVMSLLWMGVATAAILVEKVLPGGQPFARVLAMALVATGIWVAVSPASVPGLTQPGRMHMMGQARKMEMPR